MRACIMVLLVGFSVGVVTPLAAQSLYSVNGRFFDCANNHIGGLSELPQLYSGSTFLYEIQPSDSGTFQLEKLNPGPYRIKYKWVFNVHNSKHFDVYDKNIENLIVCVDSLPKKMYEETAIETQVKGGNKLRIHYSSNVNGEERKELIVLAKKGKKFKAQFISEGEEIDKIIDAKELAAFERILTEIKNLKLPDLCSEKAHYYVSIRFDDIYVTDPSCTWNAFERLKKIVFR
jgi:hypothetical protein